MTRRVEGFCDKNGTVNNPVEVVLGAVLKRVRNRGRIGFRTSE